MHHDKIVAQTTQEKPKPEIIIACNSTKSGVDTMDYMTKNCVTEHVTEKQPKSVQRM